MDVGSLGQPVAQGLDRARLADAGLPREQHDLTLALLGLLPAVEQQRELLPAAGQRREARPAQCREAAVGCTVAGDPPGPHRRCEALERVTAQVLEGE